MSTKNQLTIPLFCKVKLNRKVKLFLIIEKNSIPFSWDEKTQSHYVSFKYLPNKSIFLRITSKTDDSINGTAQFIFNSIKIGELALNHKPKNIDFAISLGCIGYDFEKQKIIPSAGIFIPTKSNFDIQINIKKNEDCNFRPMINDNKKAIDNRDNHLVIGLGNNIKQDDIYFNQIFSNNVDNENYTPFIINEKNNDYSPIIKNLDTNIQYVSEKKTDVSENKQIQKEEILENTVELFYATNRKKLENPNSFNNYFNNEILDDDSNPNIGKCLINIPDCHEKGRIERPWKILFWSLRENKNKHILLESIQEMDKNNFYSQFKTSLKNSKEKSFLLFVHGYNNTFAEAARRAGQIAYDTNFNGITGFFSWPSAGKTQAYEKDTVMAMSSVKALAEFINSMVINTGIEKLHIIAHSMGNVLVTSTLVELATNPEFANISNVIEQVILAAPDIDQIVFKKTILPKFKTIGKCRTMYISKNDFPLKVSKILTSLPRLGQGGDNAFIGEDLYTIDASNVETPDSHSYIFDTKLILNDLFLILDGVSNPKKRNLKKRESNLWYFPE